MVLEEASSGGMPEDSINSEETDRTPQGAYRFDPSKFPQPFLPFETTRTLWLNKSVHEIKAYTAHVSKLLGRPPIEAEMDAICYHITDKNRIASNGMSAGICWGLWRGWATRKEYNWPFIQPYKKYADFNPNKFVGLEGSLALQLRHLVRAGAWFAWGAFLGHFLFENYGAIRGFRAMMNDDRLKALNEARRESMRNRSQGQAAGGPPPSTTAIKVQGDDGVFDGESQSFSGSAGFSAETQASTRQTKQWTTTPPPDAVPQDDASPTGGLGLWDDDGESASRGSSWDRVRQQSAPTRPTGQAPETISSEDDWVSTEASSQQPQVKSGAWDRIRQQNQQGAPQQQKRGEEGWWK